MVCSGNTLVFTVWQFNNLSLKGGRTLYYKSAFLWHTNIEFDAALVNLHYINVRNWPFEIV